MTNDTEVVEHEIESVPLLPEVTWFLCRRCGRGGYTLPTGDERECRGVSGDCRDPDVD